MSIVKQYEITFGQSSDNITRTFKMNSTSDDLNGITTPGMYCVYDESGNHHAPANGWWFLLVFNLDNVAIKQIALSPWDGAIKQRNYSNNAWGNWATIST